jgi:hypothetical protein
MPTTMPTMAPPKVVVSTSVQARLFGADKGRPGSARQATGQETEKPAEHGAARESLRVARRPAAMRAVKRANRHRRSQLGQTIISGRRYRLPGRFRLLAAHSFWTAHQILLASWLAMPV